MAPCCGCSRLRVSACRSRPRQDHSSRGMSLVVCRARPEAPPRSPPGAVSSASEQDGLRLWGRGRNRAPWSRRTGGPKIRVPRSLGTRPSAAAARPAAFAFTVSFSSAGQVVLEVASGWAPGPPAPSRAIRCPESGRRRRRCPAGSGLRRGPGRAPARGAAAWEPHPPEDAGADRYAAAGPGQAGRDQGAARGATRARIAGEHRDPSKARAGPDPDHGAPATGSDDDRPGVLAVGRGRCRVTRSAGATSRTCRAPPVPSAPGRCRPPRSR